MAKTILVTGANGNVASTTISLLTGHGATVRALVRHPERAERLRAGGVEVVAGDLEKPTTLGPAFTGVDTAFVVAPASPRAPEHSSNALWAARQAGVRRIVRLSAFGAAHDAPTINGRLHALSDSELVASEIPYTILKPHFFMQNLLMSVGSVKSDSAFYLPLGQGRLAMIDIQDIAEFAAHVLTTDGHDNQIYSLTGPESISMDKVAAAASAALQRQIAYVPVPIEAGLQAIEKMGVDEWSLNLLRDYFIAYSRNWGDKVFGDFEAVMKKHPRGIEQFARDCAQAFQ